MGRTRFSLFIIIAVAMVAPASAQLLSNATLNGAYYFRYLGSLTDPSDNARSFQGTITFDGAGRYTVTGQGAAGVVGGLRPLTSGTYNVGSGGLFYMLNPVDNTSNTFLYGGVGINNIIVASSTDTLYCDLFVAFPVSTASSNATLSGNYNVASLEFLNGSFTSTRNTLFSMTSNGSGSLGDVTIKGTAQNLQNAPTTQTSLAATYSVAASGTGTLNLPPPTGQSAANTLLAGNKTLYVSSDGNLFVAGTASGFDMVIGVKAYSGGAPNTALSGLFYTGLLENYVPGNGNDSVYSAQGASNILGGAGIELAHQRTNPDGFASYDWTFSGAFTFNADATYTQPSYAAFVIGTGGNYVLGSGDGTNYQLQLYVKAATVGGTGVFVNPQAILNAASSIPFTAQVAPGELVSLYGSGMAGQTVTASSLPFPTELGGVKVTVNGAEAPLYYVSPTLISLVVPYSAPDDGSFVRFQVTSGGTASNTVETYSGLTSPGIFTIPAGGVGSGAVLHADYSVVSNANPAKPGETIAIFLTGLGKVTGNVAAGAAGPTNPLSSVVNNLAVYIDDLAARVDFKGLAPQLAGLYQLNVVVPANVSDGDVVLDIETVDAVNFQATIRVAR